MKLRGLIRATAVLLLLGSVLVDGVSHAALASSTEDAAPVLIGSYGMWDLKRLGYQELTMPVTQKRETVSIGYRLADSAAQGPADWYLAHLDFEATVDPESGVGYAYLAATTNGYTAAMARLEVTRDQDGRPAFDWSTVDMLRGYVRGTGSTPSLMVAFSNYLPVRGVIPGANTLAFVLRQYGDIRIASVRILDSSGIEYTPLAPPQLEIVLDPLERTPRVGDRVEVSYEVLNHGGAAPERLEVRPVFNPDALELLGPDALAAQPPSFPLRGSFEFRALASGDHQVELAVLAGSANGPSARLDVQVLPRYILPAHAPALFTLAAALAGSYVLVRTGVFLLRRLRRPS